ncbi:MAG: FGGY family carbohydrate kinase [Halioglobus sp.]
MQKPWLMGIDLGGSGARCVLVNRASGALVSASGSWRFAAAPGTFGTGYDIDLEKVWEVVGTVCRDAITEAGIAPESVAAIAVAAMRFSTVVLDGSGNSLLAVDNRDARRRRRVLPGRRKNGAGIAAGNRLLATATARIGAPALAAEATPTTLQRRVHGVRRG